MKEVSVSACMTKHSLHLILMVARQMVCNGDDNLMQPTIGMKNVTTAFA